MKNMMSNRILLLTMSTGCLLISILFLFKGIRSASNLPSESSVDSGYSVNSKSITKENTEKYKCISDSYFITATDPHTEDLYGYSIKIEKGTIWERVSESSNSEYVRLERYSPDTEETFFIWDHYYKIEEHFELIED